MPTVIRWPRVLRTKTAHVASGRRDERTLALAEILSGFLLMDEPRKPRTGEGTALDIHYDLGEGHPLMGRRMPDLDVVVGNEPTCVFELLHQARPLLVDPSRRKADVRRGRTPLKAGRRSSP